MRPIIEFQRSTSGRYIFTEEAIRRLNSTLAKHSSRGVVNISVSLKNKSGLSGDDIQHVIQDPAIEGNAIENFDMRSGDQGVFVSVDLRTNIMATPIRIWISGPREKCLAIKSELEDLFSASKHWASSFLVRERERERERERVSF